MTLVDNAALVRKRIRRDGPINPVGVTTLNHVRWRIGDGPHRETPISAVQAAERRVHNTADGMTCLSGEMVNPSDLIALLSEVRAVDRGKKQRLCDLHLTTLAGDGHCPACVNDQTRWE